MARAVLGMAGVILAAAFVAWAPSHATGSVELPAPPVTAVEAALSGDVNCSGRVDAVDALQILRSVAGLPASANCLEAAGDTDCNGKTDAVDALRILRYVADLQNQYPEGCPRIGEPTVSSDQLIDAALQAGEITDEQATVYHVFAAFNDSRLPQKFRGSPSALPDSDATLMAAVKFDGLSPEAQDSLLPFLVPPYAEGSWLDLRTPSRSAVVPPTPGPSGWTSVEAVGGRVKVWARNDWPTEVIKATDVAQAVSDTIWPALIDLMGEEHAPLTDDEYPVNGGDGALDIYIVDIEGARGLTVPYVDVPETDELGPCEMTPAFIEIEPDQPLGSATEAGIISTVAHEIFHAFQLSFDLYTDCWFPEYKWFMEASATWAEDYVYPGANDEHDAAFAFLSAPSLPLDTLGLFFSHEYGAYLFPFYVSRKYSAPSIVRVIWETFGAQTSIPAIQSAIEPYGGFQKLWPDFVLHNWNGTTTSWYQDWDGLPHGAEPQENFPTIVYPGGEYGLDASVNYLAAHYFRVMFPVWDNFKTRTRSLIFHNTLAGYPHANVQAITRIGGDYSSGGVWQEPEDWSGKETISFCRDDPEDRVEEIIVILSNSDWETQEELAPILPPTIEGSDLPCTRWVGEAQLDYEESGYFLRSKKAVASDLVFERDDSRDHDDWRAYSLTSGTLEVTLTATVPDCRDGAPGSATATGTFSIGGGLLEVSNPGNQASGAVEYWGVGYSEAVALEAVVVCDVGGFTYSQHGLFWLYMGGAQPMGTERDHIQGEYVSPVGERYRWDFRAAPPDEAPSAIPP